MPSFAPPAIADLAAAAALLTAEDKPVLAAIDLGTNSTHMVVVRVDPTLPSFEILNREKTTTRLGDRDPKTGELTPAAMERALAALARCRDLAASFRAHEILAVATSAVREAPNGRDFLDQVQARVGLRVNLISGPEEARRIYLGVLSGMELDGRPHAVIDIGGGSTEIILGNGQEPRFLSSTKVGAVRLSHEFVHSDPISDPEFEALRAYARGMLERATDDLRASLLPEETIEQVRLVGTSGTIECLTALHAFETTGTLPDRLQGYRLSRAALDDIIERLRRMTLAERLALPGLGDRRGEIILSGAVILQAAMDLLEMESLVACDRALREGVVVDWMLAHGLIEDRMRYQGSVRERNAIALAKKYQVNLASAAHVAELTLTLFDQTRGTLHQWGEEVREYLWTAAILHNCGNHIAHDAHHKHAYYLIRHGQLLGFSEPEIEVIANLARYHRKSAPKKRHETYQALATKRERQLVDELSPLLRLAAALDRRQIGAVRCVQCQYRPPEPVFRLLISPAQPEDDCAIERWSVECERSIFEQQFGVKLQVEIQ